jgi:hypothetical protein
MSQDAIVNQIFFEKFKATKKLNSGSFGIVYQGVHIKSKEVLAMKIVKNNLFNTRKIDRQTTTCWKLKLTG